jgi:hypothetical protein
MFAQQKIEICNMSIRLIRTDCMPASLVYNSSCQLVLFSTALYQPVYNGFMPTSPVYNGYCMQSCLNSYIPAGRNNDSYAPLHNGYMPARHVYNILYDTIAICQLIRQTTDVCQLVLITTAICQLVWFTMAMCQLTTAMHRFVTVTVHAG